MADQLSIRALQVAGVIYLREYCRVLSIDDPAIDSFISHAASLAVSVDLPTWEQKFHKLEITGLGDPLPKRLTTPLPIESVKVLLDLIECVAEIGVSQMYGATKLDESEAFLRRAEEIATGVGVSQIQYSRFEEDSMPAGDPWGKVVTPVILEKWLLAM